MDTTSHNITWTTYTLGDGSGSSTLYDVAIINDTLAYAVGEIHSGGTMYNVAKWNGQTWAADRIQSIICGSSTYIVRDLYAVFAFNSDNVWFSDGAEIMHWDGNKYSNDCSMNAMLTGAILKIWGVSNKDLYAVGRSGNIIHYDGTSWTKIESGTSMDIYDICGSSDGSQILAIACEDGINKKLIQIQGTTASFLNDTGLPNFIYGLWFVPNKAYYIVGGGVYTKHSLEETSWKRQYVTAWESGGVRGNDINDVFVTGGGLEIVHFNGATWHTYSEFSSTTASIGSLAIKGDLMITVGLDGAKAIAIVGKR
jgi:hypothetical protein